MFMMIQYSYILPKFLDYSYALVISPICVLTFSVVYAVNVHRFVILGERASGLITVPGLRFVRLVLLLPSVAVGGRIRFSEAWKRSEGSAMRLVAAFALVMVPVTALSIGENAIYAYVWRAFALQPFLSHFVFWTTHYILMGLHDIFRLNLVSFQVVLLSLAYKSLFGPTQGAET
jgi:hypothetical protein